METARQVPGLPVLHQQQQLTPEDCRGHQAERKERRISCHSKDQQVWLPGRKDRKADYFDKIMSLNFSGIVGGVDSDGAQGGRDLRLRASQPPQQQQQQQLHNSRHFYGVTKSLSSIKLFFTLYCAPILLMSLRIPRSKQCCQVAAINVKVIN